jgi:apolipoprotein N-acyltransferase
VKSFTIALGLTVASGVAFALAFPPAGWSWLGWGALAPLFVALRGGGLGRALALAWLWCLVATWGIGDWFPRAVATYFGQSAWVAFGLFAGVLTFMAGVYYMAFAAAYRALARRYGSPPLPLLAGAAWTVAELGRGRLLTATPFFIGNPWGLVGYSQADVLPVVQIAAVTGIYGVGFAMGCVNAGLAELWIGWGDAAGLRRRLVSLALACAPALLVVAYGAVTLGGADPPDTPVTRVAIVQGNLNLGSRWHSDFYGKNLDVYMQLTHQASLQGDPAIVFWPEAAMTFFLEDDPLYQEAIARVLRHDGIELVAGAPRARGDPPLFYNSIYVIAEDGTISGRYDKEYLVPFSEYFPLRVDVLKRRFGRVREMQPAESVSLLPTRAGAAGVVICNESMFPEVVAARVAQGASYLFNPSNDSWVSEPKYTEQQFDIAVLRAIEQRRYLVRASTAGPSAVVDPWGRVLVRSQLLTRDVILGEIHPREGITVYGRVGDLFAFVCLAAVVLAVAARSRPRGARPATR